MLYREISTGFLCEFASNPGAGYTAVTAMPTDTVANRVAWWRTLDTYGQTSSWHPSVTRDPEDPGEATISIQFSQDAALISADPDGTVTNPRDPGNTYYLGASTQVRVYRGLTDVTITEGWTLTKVEEGCTSTLAESGGLFTLKITNIPLLATQSGYVRITATREGSGTFVKDFRFLKVFQGQDGASGLVMDLDNENQTVAAQKDGTWISGTTATTTARLYLGATQLTSGITWSVQSATTGITYSQTNNTSSYTVTVTSMTAALASGTITVAAVFNGTTYTQVFTISKANAGSDGTPATVYWLQTSASAIAKDSAGTYNPTSITLNAYSQTGTNAAAAYTGRFRVQTQATPNGAWTTRYDSAGNEASATYSVPTGIVAVKVLLYQAGGTTTLLDQETLPIVSDGQDGTAYTCVLTNESHTVPFTNNVGDYSGSGTTVLVYKGGAQLGTSGGTGADYFTVSAAGSSITAGTISGAVIGNHSSMTASTATVTVTVTIKNSAGTTLATITKLQSLSKTTDGKSLSLTATSFVVNVVDENTVPAPNYITLTTTSRNLAAGTSPSYEYRVTNNGTTGSWTAISLSNPYSWLTDPGSSGRMIWNYVEWRVTQDGLSDTITVCYVKNGTSGTRGSRQIVITGSSNWDNYTAWDGIVSRYGGTPVLSDLVTIVNSSNNTSTSKFLTANSSRPGTWETVNAYISGNLLVTGSVGANQIAANAITADKIAAGTITSTQIAANGITADKITSGTLTAGWIALTNPSGGYAHIASQNWGQGSDWVIRSDGYAVFNNVDIRGRLNAGDINAGSLNVDRIFANTITGSKIAIGNNGVATSNIVPGAITWATAAWANDWITPSFYVWITATTITVPANTNRGPMLMNITLTAKNGWTSKYYVNLRVTRTGAEFYGSSPSNGCIDSLTFTAVDSYAPTSSYTYNIQVLFGKVDPGYESSFTRVIGGSILELKR